MGCVGVSFFKRTSELQLPMAGAVRAVTVSFIEHGIAVLRMQRGEKRINKEFLEAFNSCLDEVER